MKTPQQSENLKIAQRRWAEVDPDRVRLDIWQCGTQACFGGWCCTFPEFREQGLRAYMEGQREDGSLELVGEPVLEGCPGPRSVAHELFGDIDLFEFRGSHSADDLDDMPTDHEVVANRLKCALENP